MKIIPLERPCCNQGLEQSSNAGFGQLGFAAGSRNSSFPPSAPQGRGSEGAWCWFGSCSTTFDSPTPFKIQQSELLLLNYISELLFGASQKREPPNSVALWHQSCSLWPGFHSLTLREKIFLLFFSCMNPIFIHVTATNLPCKGKKKRIIFSILYLFPFLDGKVNGI